MSDLLRVGRYYGKKAAIQAQIDAWVALHGHDPTVETWIVGPEGTLRWDVTWQRWERVSPSAWGQTQ